MDAARTNHIIRFGPLTFRPVKGKLKKKTANEFELPLQRNFRFTQQMEAGHVATHMIFYAITADQNARIRILHRGDHRGSAGKSGRFAPNGTTDYDRQNEARGSPNMDLVLNPGFLTVRHLFILSASTPFCCLQSS